ncbi:excinuclease ABC subunit UvrC [Patescibacteria group bacterium]|nr:excinuclease ABC subunit UvrC [Patescibacteria group bacterium]
MLKSKKYEKAAHLRDQIQAIKKVTAKQKVITLKNENYDIVSLARKDDLTCVNLFIVRHGKLINKLNFILEHTKNSKDAEIIESFISQYYANSNDIPKEIVVPKKLSIINYQLFDQEKCKKSTISTPSRGKKYQLITLGTQNAQDYLKQQLNNQTIEQSNNEKVLTELKKLLRLPKPPRRIEAYDISNIQGTDATGSLAVFTNGQPDKSEYRKFKIRTVKSASDVAMMAEVVSRRLQNKDWPKPDLILLDGGKPQLNAVSKINTVKLLIINYQLSIISLAKKEEHIFLPNRSQPIVLPKSSSVLQLLQRIRDEAHRFARSYYLKRHQKTSVHSALDDIPGIGPKTKKGLLQKFGSVGGIKKATLAEITKVAGKKRADAIQELL